MTSREEDVDSWCDPERPWILNYERIAQAEKRIRPYVQKSFIQESHSEKKFVMKLYYKVETFHPTGSFKERGALNVLLQRTKNDKSGIVVASIGNEAYSMAYYCAKFEVKVTVVLPNYVSLFLKQKIGKLGAEIIVLGRNLYEAQHYARLIARDRGLVYMNGRDHPFILEGYGSIAVEIIKDIPLVDCIIVPVGGGGLASAVTTVVKKAKPSCLVYGVEPEMAQAFANHKSAEEQRERDYALLSRLEEEGADEEEIEDLRENILNYTNMYPPKETIADSIAVSQVGVNAFHNAYHTMDRILQVEENSIALAVLHMMEWEGLVVEGAAACPVAAIIQNLVPELKTKTVVCILTGGNIDSAHYIRSLERGLSTDCRLIEFTIHLENSTTCLTRLMTLLQLANYVVVKQEPVAKWTDLEESSIFETPVEMNFTCMAMNKEHGLELKKIMDKAYPNKVEFATYPFNKKEKCLCFRANTKSQRHNLFGL